MLQATSGRRSQKVSADGFIHIRNFDQFQHYKDRNPPWIKLHAALLDDYFFSKLPDSAKWTLIGLWILASKSENNVPNDPKWLKSKLHIKKPLNLKPLSTGGFISITASREVADCGQTVSPRRVEESRAEERREETEGQIAKRRKRHAREKADVAEVVEYLNKVVGAKYKASTKTTSVRILARMKEGHSVADFKTIVDKKAKQWLRTDREQYLRPETLWSAKHFESYLNQVINPEAAGSAGRTHSDLDIDLGQRQGRLGD